MDALRVAVAQIAPVFLDREATLARVEERVREAAAEGAGLVCFGEALVPGYPWWLSRADGARFEEPELRAAHARYARAAVVPEEHLGGVRAAAREVALAVVLGVVERALDRGGHSLYCTRVFIDAEGEIASTHRKLVPTYEERLAWGNGDGAGLVTHPVGAFRVGALNCWENWMPLARAALQAAGEDLHVMLWPGSLRNTAGITQHVAREGRSFVVSVSGLTRPEDVPEDVPLRPRWVGTEPLADGGVVRLACVDLDPREVDAARQSFDPAGHYSRPDVLRLFVDRRRQRVAEWIDPSPAG